MPDAGHVHACGEKAPERGQLPPAQIRMGTHTPPPPVSLGWVRAHLTKHLARPAPGGEGVRVRARQGVAAPEPSPVSVSQSLLSCPQRTARRLAVPTRSPSGMPGFGKANRIKHCSCQD